MDSVAEAFAAAGFACLAFDNRNFGASDDEPWQEIDPSLQIRGDASSDRQEAYRLWGSSYSDGHVLVVGAIDRRDVRRVAGAADQRACSGKAAGSV
jgi:hypothetical protein